MVVEDAQTGYVGAVVRIEYGRMELEDRHGRTQAVPGRPRIPDRRQAGDPDRAATRRRRQRRRVPRRVRSRCRARKPRWRWPAASTSRAATTPNSSSRCGATTCASRASSSNTSAGSTIWSAIVEEFGPGPGRRLGVLVDHLVAGSKEARIASQMRCPARAGRRAHPGGRSPVHRHLAGGQAGPARHLRVAGRSRAASTGSTACAAALGWPHAQQADIARAWQRIRGRVRDWNDLEPALIGRVEELIDFVTTQS